MRSSAQAEQDEPAYFLGFSMEYVVVIITPQLLNHSIQNVIQDAAFDSGGSFLGTCHIISTSPSPTKDGQQTINELRV